MHTSFGLPTDEMDLLICEQRGLRREPVPDHSRLGVSGHERVQQQRRRQRTMRDETGVTLDFGDVRVVVMDAVGVERQRRIPEQHDLTRPNRARPVPLVRDSRVFTWGLRC